MPLLVQSRNSKAVPAGVGALTLISNKWNEKYAEDLADKSQVGLKAMNRGVSHLVAPLSYSQNHKVQTICHK